MTKVLVLAALTGLIVGSGSGCSSAPERDAAKAPSRAVSDASSGAAGAGPGIGAGDAQATAAAVILEPPGRSPVRVTVEIARTQEERRRGLMYRQNLPPAGGMLFLFSEDEIHSFWMKNTLIPLDMIFIRRDQVVVGVVENATPRTLDGRSVDKVSLHVLEVNGGFAREHGIGEGTKVRFENVDMTGIDE